MNSEDVSNYGEAQRSIPAVMAYPIFHGKQQFWPVQGETRRNILVKLYGTAIIRKWSYM